MKVKRGKRSGGFASYKTKQINEKARKRRKRKQKQNIKEKEESLKIDLFIILLGVFIGVIILGFMFLMGVL